MCSASERTWLRLSNVEFLFLENASFPPHLKLLVMFFWRHPFLMGAVLRASVLIEEYCFFNILVSVRVLVTFCWLFLCFQNRVNIARALQIFISVE